MEFQVELRRNHTGVKIVLLTGQFHAYKCKDFVCLYLAQPWQKPLGFAAVKFGVAKKVSSLVALNPTTFIPRLWLVHIIVDRKKVSKCQKAVGRKFTDYSGKQSFYCRYFEMKARVHILFEKNYRITICLTAKKMFTWRSKTKNVNLAVGSTAKYVFISSFAWTSKFLIDFHCITLKVINRDQTQLK